MICYPKLLKFKIFLEVAIYDPTHPIQFTKQPILNKFEFDIN